MASLLIPFPAIRPVFRSSPGVVFALAGALWAGGGFGELEAGVVDVRVRSVSDI